MRFAFIQKVCDQMVLKPRESVVSTLQILFGSSVSKALTTAMAASLLVFSLLYTPCVAAITSMKRELGARWATLIVVWQCVVAWFIAWIVYVIATMV